MSLSLAGAMLGASALGIGGSLIGAGINTWSANHAAHQNQRYAVQQQQYQKMMSDTAHQREVEDLRAAGLNPILSATGGSGASTPTGQSGSIAQAGDFDSNSASNLAKEMYKYWDSQKANTEADTDTKNEVAKTEKKKQDLLTAQKDLLDAQFPEVSSGAELNWLRNQHESIIQRRLMGDESYNKWLIAEKKAQPIFGTVLPVAKTASGMVNSAAMFHNATRTGRTREFSNGLSYVDNYF